MKDLRTFISEAKLDPNSEDNKAIDYIFTSFNDNFDKFIKGVKKIQEDWDCDINDIVKVRTMPAEKAKMESIKTLYKNLSDQGITLPKSKASELSFEIDVKFYYDPEKITYKAFDYILKDKKINELRDSYLTTGFGLKLRARPNQFQLFVIEHGTRLSDEKWVHEVSDVKEAIDNFAYKCPLFENPNKIESAKKIQAKFDEMKELMSKYSEEDIHPKYEAPIAKDINKESEVVKYIFNDVLNISGMDIDWDKETIEFGKKFVELVSKWAKDVKSKDDLTIVSSKPSYWKELTKVDNIKKTTRSKVTGLLTDDSISNMDWVEVCVNGDNLVIVADTHDAGSDYFDMVIKK